MGARVLGRRRRADLHARLDDVERVREREADHAADPAGDGVAEHAELLVGRHGEERDDEEDASREEEGDEEEEEGDDEERRERERGRGRGRGRGTRVRRRKRTT